MCTIFIAKDCHPKYNLIVAANRDEFLKRPTQKAHYWDGNNIIAGKDLEKGGTWMGITKTGSFAAITNYREQVDNNIKKKSRGDLVANYLKNNVTPSEYIETITKIKNEYSGFNLIIGNKDSLYYCSNRFENSFEIERGIHGLSNGNFNSEWPKVSYGKKKLSLILKQGNEISIEQLFALLINNTQYDDETLPDTGVGIDLERKLSALFIRNGEYGTKSSTVILRSSEQFIFIERYYNDDLTFNDKRFVVNLI